MRRPFAFASLVALALAVPALAGCAPPPPPRPTFAELTWSHLAPFRLDVAKVEVVSEYEPPFQAPNIEHLLDAPPEKALRRWARDRIRAAGVAGEAKVIIKDASVVEVDLEVEKDLRGYFTTEQGQRYDAAVEVTIEVYGVQGERDGYVTARAERSQTVPEDITLNERDRVLFTLIEAVMKDFDAEMGRNIARHLKRFLK